MTRYVIDAQTLLQLVDSEVRIDDRHQLVAPNRIRSEALELLLRDVRAARRTEQAALACHERVTELKMRLLGDRASRGLAWRIARDQDWDTLRDGGVPRGHPVAGRRSRHRGSRPRTQSGAHRPGRSLAGRARWRVALQSGATRRVGRVTG